MIFLGSCKDSVGIVAKISGFFAEHNENILHLEEHTEDDRFFIRIETDCCGSRQVLEKAFAPLAKELAIDFTFYDRAKNIKLALFCSGTLHCPLELISRQLSGALPIEIQCIISNSKAIEETAKKLQIPFHFTKTAKESFAHEKEQFEILRQYDIDLITLARYMKILSADFIEQVKTPIINIHHSFLPSFIGGRPYEMAYERGVKMVGATAHFVTKDLDEGPIIAQGVLPVDHTYSVERMKREGENIEKLVFAQAISKFANRKILLADGRTVVFR
jgi:formyltetrahydrofolate deformylase